MYRVIKDWDDAYRNSEHIPDGAAYPERWRAEAQAFRERLTAAGRAKLDISYGEKERNHFDLFSPEGEAKGLVVFVHGGYWMRFDKSLWSHLAAGPLANGFAVAMPSYTLCPDTRIAGITAEVGAAVTAAAGRVSGPLHLAGHSAGGHLASRMVCATSPLGDDVRGRIVNTISISGVHDLRPLMHLANNAIFRIDRAEALAESPALLEPLPGTRLTCWVGAAERAEFVRQNALLANAWTGLGAHTATVEEPDRHHFTVVEGLREADHPLTRTLLAT